MALCLVFIRRLFQFSVGFFFRISNFFDLSITEETWVVKMRIWCIKIVNVLVLHLIPRDLSHPARVGSNSARIDVTVWEGLSVYLRNVGGLFPNTLNNVSGLSLLPIKHWPSSYNWKIVEYGKNSKQWIKQSLASFSSLCCSLFKSQI
jgi:hypothetical protein